MDAILRFFITYAPLFYILLAVGLLIAIRRIALARQESHESIYGLERELSHRHMSQAVAALGIIILLAFAELFLVIFLAPNLPARSLLLTPTINPLSVPTNTLSLQSQKTPAAGATGSSPATEVTGCIPGQIMITSPGPGDEIRGEVTLRGSADIPNFGYYKYEFAARGSDNWSTIQAARKIVKDNTLGTWDTSELPSGDYSLRLVVTDSQANVLPACIIPVRVVAP
jgi:hypothetical protein